MTALSAMDGVAVETLNATRVWNHALEGWSLALAHAPDDEKTQSWHARCSSRIMLLQKGSPSNSAADASEGVEALVRCARKLNKQFNDYNAAIMACENVLIERPDHADAHGLRCDCLMQAGRWSELPAALDAGRAYLTPDMLARLARLATRQEHWSEALELWRLLARQGAPDTSIARLVEGQILCALKLGLDTYRPEVPPSTSVPEGDRRPRLSNSDPRHIVIAGVSFCGSTLLGLVLGGLPGIANVGESHWLIEKRRQRSSDELPLSIKGFEQCMSCGPGCGVVTDDLRRRLADPGRDFYATLAEAFQANTIVTSDKSFHHVLKLDPYLQNDTVVLFREPMVNWQSHCARHPEAASPQGQSDYFRNWAKTYDILLRYFHNTGDKIVVNFDDFAVTPQETLDLICETLSLPFDPDALAYWDNKQHFVGGNIKLSVRMRDKDREALKIRPRAAAADGVLHADAVDEFARARQIWEALKQAQLRDRGEHAVV